MSFPVPGFVRIRSDLLRDLKNFRPDADVTVDSDFYVRATAVASAVEGLYQHQAWIVRQIFPDTADSEYLRMHAAVRGMEKKQAIVASGLLKISGPEGTLVPDGLKAKRDDGILYSVVGDQVIGPGDEALIPCNAVEVGPTGNTDGETPVTLQEAPSGVDVNAVLVEMRGGTDIETDTELLARLLDIIRRPPAGGNRHDFRRWAMEVSGVTNAFVYPLRRGLGTVDIAIVSADGLPSGQTLQRVRDHIDDVRPVTAKGVLVIAPAIRIVDISAEVASTALLADVTPEIIATLNDQFALIAPGEAWIRSHAEARISNVAGIFDRQITSPASNVVPVVDEHIIEWLRPGVFVVDDMV